jgi:hypothetical protein
MEYVNNLADHLKTLKLIDYNTLVANSKFSKLKSYKNIDANYYVYEFYDIQSKYDYSIYFYTDKSVNELQEFVDKFKLGALIEKQGRTWMDKEAKINCEDRNINEFITMLSALDNFLMAKPKESKDFLRK